MPARIQLARLRRQIERRAVPALELDLPIGRFARLHFLGRFGQESHRDDLAVTGVDAPRLFANLSLKSEEHTSELQSLMRISYDVFCLKKKTQKQHQKDN